MKASLEQITHPHHSFRFLRFETEGFEGEPHRHQHMELTWIESGEGLRCVGDRIEPFEAGDLVLIGSETPHCWLSSRGSGPGVATVAQFSPAFIGQPGLPELARAAPLLERAAVGLAIRGACCAQVIPNLVAMQACGAIGRLGRLLEILDVLVDHEPDLIPIAQSSMRVPDARVDLAPTSRRIDRVVGWIHRELGRTLTVAEGAHVARITPGGFSRYFRTAVGKTFTQYVNDVRCGEACLRLRRSDKAVALIAAECGFETMSHFNRQFRLRMGMTPRDFRRGRPLGSIHEARP